MDENGNYLDECLGTCGAHRKVNNVNEPERDPMQGLMEVMMAQVDKMIKSEINYTKIEFQKDQIALYKKAFQEGVRFGIELGQEYLGHEYL
ncbi:MAG TPA: hypothetical protein ACFYDZ_00405 [Candidatus Brocadiaceae bacterium]